MYNKWSADMLFKYAEIKLDATSISSGFSLQAHEFSLSSDISLHMPPFCKIF